MEEHFKSVLPRLVASVDSLSSGSLKLRGSALKAGLLFPGADRTSVSDGPPPSFPQFSDLSVISLGVERVSSRTHGSPLKRCHRWGVCLWSTRQGRKEHFQCRTGSTDYSLFFKTPFILIEGRRWSDFDQYVAPPDIFGIPKRRPVMVGSKDLLPMWRNSLLKGDGRRCENLRTGP